jgi:hypothetical protein
VIGGRGCLPAWAAPFTRMLAVTDRARVCACAQYPCVSHYRVLSAGDLCVFTRIQAQVPEGVAGKLSRQLSRVEVRAHCAERERQLLHESAYISMSLHLYISISIYLYIYIERERARQLLRESVHTHAADPCSLARAGRTPRPVSGVFFFKRACVCSCI